MGKSSSGKDTIYRRLLEEGRFGLDTAVPYTTRPIRDGEICGREYWFTNEEELYALRQAGKVIEERKYIINDDTPFAITEAYKGLRTNVTFSRTSEGCRVIGLTSSFSSGSVHRKDAALW